MNPTPPRLRGTRKVAIFDVDGTIFRSSLLIELVNELIDQGTFPTNAREEYEQEYIAWLDRKGDYYTYIMAVVSVFIKYIKGVHLDEITKAAHIVTDHHKNRVYRYTRDLIKQLKTDGYYILAISHSPKLILDSFGASLGFDKMYGIMYELDSNNKFTGEMIDKALIFDKAKVLKRAVDKEGLTLEGSVGVGDTESDVVFLELVEKPVCFNPNLNLYKEAKNRGWRVVVERKDVVYEL